MLNIEKQIRRDSKIYFYCDEINHFIKNCFYKFIKLRFVLLIFLLFTFNTFNIFAFVRKMQKNEFFFRHRRVEKFVEFKISNTILTSINKRIENKICIYVILKNSIDDRIQNLFYYFYCFINFNVFDKVFINKFYAQKLNFEFIFLKNSRILEIFNKFEIVCESITHYVNIYFKTFLIKKNVRLIQFYIIDLFN